MRHIDPEWRDEVIRRWQRRRWKVQQREAAIAELKAALLPPFERIAVTVNRLLRR